MKKFVKKWDIICICVFFFICMIIVLRTMCVSYNKEQNDYWSIKYPYEQEVNKDIYEMISEIETEINNYCTFAFPGSHMIDKIVTYYKEMVLRSIIPSIEITSDNIDYVQEPCENVLEFKKKLNEQGIPFLYVQTPSKESVLYYNNRKDEISDLVIPERNCEMVNWLQDKDVDVINLAEMIDTSLIEKYDQSEHWFPVSALFGARTIAQHLNNEYGYNFNMQDYYYNEFIDYMDQYPKKKQAIKKYCGYDYELLVPRVEHEYSVIYAEDNTWKGKFEETLLNSSEEWLVDNGAYHNVFKLINSLVYEIHNETCETNKGKKILIIGDSFNWATSSYLSIGVEYITVIHNASFKGSLMSYIKLTQPDIVIMVYNDAELYEVYTDDAYYLK